MEWAIYGCGFDFVFCATSVGDFGKMVHILSIISGYAQNSKIQVNQIDLTTFWKKKNKRFIS